MFRFSRFLIIFHLFFFFLFSVAIVQSAPRDVDAGFNPKLTIDLVSNYNGGVLIQPDGKMLVYGTEYLVFKPYFQRLNPDGTVDPTFNCPACLSFNPSSISLQPDGKILIGGQNIVIRVMPNGSLDITYKTNFAGIGGCLVTQLKPLPDGKALFGCINTADSTPQIRRLSANGVMDLSFNATVLTNRFTISRIISLSDGKFLSAGKNFDTNRGWMQRYNADGTIDSSFQTDINANVADIDLTVDGKYMIVGDFTSVNNIGRNRIARLLPDGSPDPTLIVTLPGGTVSSLRILSNGQFYVKSSITQITTIYNLTRYNPDGSVDNTFTFPLNRGTSWTVDGSDRVVVFNDTDPSRRYFRLNIDGSIDFTFAPVLGYEGTVTAAALQSDGKVIVGGNFTRANGIQSKNLARLNADGTTDTTFNVGSGLNGIPQEITVQADGKILVGGNFTLYNDATRNKLLRLNADGSLDTAFDPNIDPTDANRGVYAITVAADGKILIGGNFTTVAGVSRTGAARLNSDGSFDASFVPPTLNALFITDTIVIQPNGQILLGGNQTLYRLDANGTRDTTFEIPIAGRVSQVIPQTDGKYLISYSANVTYGLFRANNNGSFDFSFKGISNSNFAVNAIYQQPNGNVLIGGTFSARNLQRVGPNGQWDYSSLKFGANGTVTKILGQPDGKVLVFGQFSGIEDNLRSGAARLSLRKSLNYTYFDFDGDGLSDVSVFRPSNGGWYALQSSNNALFAANFGQTGDIAVPADYDGDGKTDVAIFRNGVWYSLRSFDNTFAGISFGQAGDIPVPTDFDGDQKVDQAVYRNGNWYLYLSIFGYINLNLGNSTDIPMAGDFTGDGTADIMVYRPSNGTWYRSSPSNNQVFATNFGTSGDKPVAADYDGDGTLDIAVYRPSVGDWYWLNSSDGSFSGVHWGTNGDKPVPADYDGDGKTDIAVYRPSDGTWYLLQSTAGFKAVNWGISTDIPIPNVYVR
ncbi:MAG: FG-GAP-like repeat-containing protein [Pyrinomonadaceae bacterium]|nr:FG-GAP-like repeat-containing protein [Pyrinomonadaceae bacterium]